MGNNTKTEEDNTTGQLQPEYIKLIHLLNLLKLPIPTPEQVQVIVHGLQCFAANRNLWGDTKDPMSSAHWLIIKHMAFTMFVPGGKADRAREAVDHLDKHDVLHVLGKYENWEKAKKKVNSLVRFYPTKEKHIKAAIENLDEIREAMMSPGWSVEARRSWLVENVKGYGPKAAAHFMRNTGLMSGYNALPIIDVHIHKALGALNFEHETYEQAEKSFMQLSRLLQLPPLFLDAGLWCAYAGNWELESSDFGNFGWDTTTKKQRSNKHGTRSTNSKPNKDSTATAGKSGLCAANNGNDSNFSFGTTGATTLGDVADWSGLS